MAKARYSGLTPVQKDYLALLRSSLWGTETQVLPKDVKGVLQIANRQRTRPLIITALQKAGYNDLKVKQFIRNTAAAHLTLNHNIANLVTILRKNGIDSVLLKGQGVAQYYPEPILRECGDIDLFVGTEQYTKACEAIKPLATDSAIEETSESEKHYDIQINEVTVEIHRVSEAIANKRQNAYFQSISKRGLSENLVPIDFEGVSVNTPADSYNAFYIFHHIWHHFIYGGIGLRQICDWTMLLHSRVDYLDTSVAEEALNKLNLRTPWQIFASIAVDYLGLPASEMPFYQPGLENRAADILALILKEGNFGHARKELGQRPQKYLSGKFFSLRMFLKRTSNIARIWPEMRHKLTGFSIRYVIDGFLRIFADLFKR